MNDSYHDLPAPQPDLPGLPKPLPLRERLYPVAWLLIASYFVYRLWP